MSAIPDYPSRSFQLDGGFRTVPWDDWVGMRRRALDLERDHVQWVRDHQTQTDHDQHEIARLRKALTFYANGESWCHPGGLHLSPAVEDRGMHATETLGGRTL